MQSILKSGIGRSIKHAPDAQLQQHSVSFRILSPSMSFSRTVPAVKDSSAAADMDPVSSSVANALAAVGKLVGCPRTCLDAVRSDMVPPWIDVNNVGKLLVSEQTPETLKRALRSMMRLYASFASFKELHDPKWRKSMLARGFRTFVPPPYLKVWSAARMQVMLAITIISVELAIVVTDLLVDGSAYNAPLLLTTAGGPRAENGEEIRANWRCSPPGCASCS